MDLYNLTQRTFRNELLVRNPLLPCKHCNMSTRALACTVAAASEGAWGADGAAGRQ